MSSDLIVQNDGPVAAEQFQVDVSEHLAELRRSLGRLLTDLGSPRTPTVLQKTLNVGYAICWQIFRVARADDVAGEAHHAPSPGSLKKLLARAAKKGVSSETIDAVEKAADDLRAFVQRHAEDRDAFDSMVAAAAPVQKTKGLLIQRRRAAYRAMSHVWGSQTDLYLITAIYRRSPADPTKLDAIWLTLQQGIRRLRPDAHVTLMGHYHQPHAGDKNESSDEGYKPFLSHALDREAADQFGMPILPEFSTKPFPQIQELKFPDGWRFFNLMHKTVGLRSNIDVVAGHWEESMPMVTESDGRRVEFVNFVNTRKSVAMGVIDVLLPRDSFPGVRLSPLIHQYQDGIQTVEAASRTQLYPVEEQVQPAVRADSAELAEMPRYRELLRYATTRVGWNLSDFDLYRFRMPFPIMGTVTRVYFYDPLQDLSTAAKA